MKRLILVLALLSSSCTTHPPNLTPLQTSQFKSDQYLTALSDFQDGVEVGFRAGWLSRKDTHTIAEVLAVAAVTIHASPDGARAAALSALDEIQSKVDMNKLSPYLSSVRLVVEGLK